jgi:predicted transport protein
MQKVAREVRQYTIGDHIKPSWNKSESLFDEFSQRVLELDPRFEVKPVKSYIGFRIGGKNVINVKPRNSKVVIELLRTQPQDLKDPDKKVKYLKNSYKYYNQHVSLFNIENEDDIDYVMLLVKQVYKSFTE